MTRWTAWNALRTRDIRVDQGSMGLIQSRADFTETGCTAHLEAYRIWHNSFRPQAAHDISTPQEAEHGDLL